MKRKLCPRITETMSFVGFKIPQSMLREIDIIGHTTVTTRSEAVRQLLLEALRSRGRVASVAEMGDMLESVA